jgi:hypothetical protein
VRALAAADILETWELAAAAGGTGRALAMLGRTWPDLGDERLAGLPLGRRDALLLELYRQTFGDELDLFVSCPSCGQGLELEVTAADLLAGRPAEELAPPSGEAGQDFRELEADGLWLHFRLTSSADLAAAEQAPDPAAARTVLVERVVAAARRDGEEIAPAELYEHELQRLSAALAAADPLAEVVFDLECRVCSHRWQVSCDVADCCWRQLDAAARRLLREVHLLARGYGWREADVLALAPLRRRHYLEMLALE